MNARAIPLLGILLLGVTTVATAQNRLPSIPQTLSLQDALDLAETYSPTYMQTTNDRAAAAWGVRNAYASILPTLNATARGTYRGAGVQRFLTTEFRQPSAPHIDPVVVFPARRLVAEREGDSAIQNR